MDLPTNVGVGTVTGRYISDVIDGADANQDPDVVAVQGRIVFMTSVPYLPNPTALPDPVTIMRKPIVGVLDTEGYLCTPYPGTMDPMYRGVNLIATDDPDIAVQNWTWDVTYAFDLVDGYRLNIPAHGFSLPGGETVDLTKVAKVPSSPGYSLPQAEAAILRAESSAAASAQDAATALAAAERAEQAAGATDIGVASLLGDTATDTGALLAEKLEPKADLIDVTEALQSKADVETLATKADTAAVNEALATKADLTEGKVPESQVPDRLSETALSAEIDDSVNVLMEKGPGILAVNHGVLSVALGSADLGVYSPDMTSPINNLITAVSASGGGKIILPPGELRHDLPILPKSNVLLVGSGMGATILLPLQYGFLHTNADPSNVLFNFHQRDMTVWGRRAPGATWKGWHGQYHQQCSWQDVEYKMFGMTGLGPDYLRDCVISNVHTYDTGRNNDGTQPSGNGIGFAVGGSWLDGSKEETFVVMGCHVRKTANFGIMWEGGAPNVAGQAYGGAIVTGNTVTECRGGINASGGRNAVIASNYVYGNIQDGIKLGLGTLTNSAPGWRALVTGNQAYNNGRHGILYDEVEHAKLGDTVKISDNFVSANVADGIRINTGGSDLAGVDVSNNFLHANTLAGIRVKSVNAKKIFALKMDDNMFASNYASAGGASAANIGQLILEGVDVQGGSISDNVFHGTGATQRQCIAVGTSTAPALLTGVKVHGNVPPSTGTNVTAQVANATLTGCDVRGNIGYYLGNPEQQTVTASPFTYTAGPTPETVYVRAGTVSAIRKGGIAVFINTDNAVPLEPGQSVVIEYSSLPVVYRERRQ